MLRDLGLSVGADAMPVSCEWISLLPTGAALEWESFGIPAPGARSTTQAPTPACSPRQAWATS